MLYTPEAYSLPTAPIPKALSPTVQFMQWNHSEAGRGARNDDQHGNIDEHIDSSLESVVLR